MKGHIFILIFSFLSITSGQAQQVFEVLDCPFRDNDQSISSNWEKTKSSLASLDQIDQNCSGISLQAKKLALSMDEVQNYLKNNYNNATCKNYPTYFRISLDTAQRYFNQKISPSKASSEVLQMYKKCGWKEDQIFFSKESNFQCLEDQYLSSMIQYSDDCNDKGLTSDLALSELIKNALLNAQSLMSAAVLSDQSCKNNRLINKGVQASLYVASTIGSLQIEPTYAGHTTNEALQFLGQQLSEFTIPLNNGQETQTELMCYYVSLEKSRCNFQDKRKTNDCDDCATTLEQDLPSPLEKKLNDFINQGRNVALTKNLSMKDEGDLLKYGEHLQTILNIDLNLIDGQETHSLSIEEYLLQIASTLATSASYQKEAEQIKKFIEGIKKFIEMSQQNARNQLSAEKVTTEDLQHLQNEIETNKPNLEKIIRSYFKVNSFDAAEAIQQQQRYKMALKSLDQQAIPLNRASWLKTMKNFIDKSSDIIRENFKNQFIEMSATLKNIDQNKLQKNRKDQFQIIEQPLKNCLLGASVNLLRQGSLDLLSDPMKPGFNFFYLDKNLSKANQYFDQCKQFIDCPKEAGHNGIPALGKDLNRSQLEEYQCLRLKDYAQIVDGFEKEFTNQGTLCGKKPAQLGK